MVDNGTMAGKLVVCALSGGVDSAAACALLVEQGHQVVGMTMRLYNAQGTAASSGGRCCGPRDIEDARRVCAHLAIPFYVVDFSEDFSRRVVDDFVDSYRIGQTPNPCVRCNQYIKFTPLLQRARAIGADYLATGHYARLETAEDGSVGLYRGLDTKKDQSYFLFSMPTQDIDYIRFPLGGKTKSSVRAIAKKYNLPNADKPESQEICFVPDGDYAKFVATSSQKRKLPVLSPGMFVDKVGNKVGEHSGIHQYTLGQRKGLGNVLGNQRSYVTAVRPESAEIVVGPKTDAQTTQFFIRDMKWWKTMPSQFTAAVQVRHRAKAIDCAVTVLADETNKVKVVLSEPSVCASGQAAVLYSQDRVLGGGWIQ